MNQVTHGIGIFTLLSVVVMLNSIVPGNQVDSKTGGALCNVTSRPMHECKESWNASTDIGCEKHEMITTTATNGEYANWIETASTDNCNDYDDENGWHCENYANEPSNLNCTVHVWGSWIN